MTKPQSQDAMTGGFNLEKAIDDHGPAELKAAELKVRELESKLDTARERLYRLRSIIHSAKASTHAPNHDPAPVEPVQLPTEEARNE